MILFFCQVREIEQEVTAEPDTVQHKETKQTAALDLSKRLTNARTFSDAASIKGRRSEKDWPLELVGSFASCPSLLIHIVFFSVYSLI